jgi:hypothetical protein
LDVIAIPGLHENGDLSEVAVLSVGELAPAFS